MSSGEDCCAGRKILFVCPNPMLVNNVVHGLVERGYESYVINSFDQSAKACSKYKDSIVFVSIEHEVKKRAWNEYVKTLKFNPEFGSVDVGIITERETDSIINMFSGLSFNVAYVCFHHGVDFCRQVILNFLERNNAKGKRKFVRIKCNDIHHASLSIKYKNKIIIGKIVDVSVVGMACIFSEKIILQPKLKLMDIQLRLNGSIINVTGEIAGMREVNGELIYVVMFDPIVDERSKYKIVAFISRMLQENIQYFLK